MGNNAKPFKTKPVFIEKIWGGRKLQSLFGKRLPKGKRIGESWELYDKNVPIVVKLLDIKEPLSIQVHPSGKDELWYIIEAGSDSRVYGGVYLKEQKLSKGMWIYIKSGTAHTVFPPAVLLEISQKKLITYRLYDWGRKRRALDIDKGLEAIDPKRQLRIQKGIKSFICPYFKVKIIELKRSENIAVSKGIYFLLEGKVQIGVLSKKFRQKEIPVFKKGDTFLLPDKHNIKAISKSSLFRITS